jgi:ribonucleoside-diphosphate reductase alpha chain
MNCCWMSLNNQFSPECGDSVPFGQAAVVNEEGRRKCYACGFSEC